MMPSSGSGAVLGNTQAKKLLFIKALHFFTCLSGCAWGRYSTIYLNTYAKLTPYQNGLVRGAGLLSKLALTPWWGAWSDRGEPRQLLTISVVLCALLVRPTAFSIPRPRQPFHDRQCSMQQPQRGLTGRHDSARRVGNERRGEGEMDDIRKSRELTDADQGSCCR